MQNHDRSILNGLPMPAVLIDAGQTVRAANRPAIGLLGRNILGRHYITALRQPSLLESIERVMKSRETIESQYLGRDAGNDTEYAVHIAAVDDKTILTFEDTTAARNVDQFRRDFVANVSHELRTPLTALQGFIETLRGAAKEDSVARERFLEIMERETVRMTRLVDDLLSLSRLEANERVRPSGRVVLTSVVAGTLAELEPVLDTANATVCVKDQSSGLEIPADAGELRQVLGNLIENALKYGAPGDEIVVCVGEPQHEAVLRGEGVRLSVCDHGPGIASHHLARLTERFYRVDNHRSREVGGTGLGLAIVKHIVNRHRGRLNIQSEEGQGTTVTIILPAV